MVVVSALFTDGYQIEDVRGFVKRAAGQAGFEAFAEGGSNGGIGGDNRVTCLQLGSNNETGFCRQRA